MEIWPHGRCRRLALRWSAPLVWAVACLTLWGPQVAGAYAATPPQDAASTMDSLQQLQEVVVTSQRVYKEVIPSQKLKGEELQRLNALNVADALRFFAGVQLKDYGGVGGIKTVNIRSMGTNHVGVYYDGVQLSNAQNGQVDLGQYSLDNIEFVSLYNGQKSEIFQAAKDFNSAGSIYMWTRKPRFAEGETFHAMGKLKAGSFDLVNPSCFVDLKLSERVSATFSSEWLSSSGKYEFRYQRRAVRTGEIVYDTTAVRQNGDIRATRLEGALYGRLEDGEWAVKAYNYSSSRGVPGAIVNNVWRRGERIDDNNSFVQGTYTRGFGPHYRTRLLAKYAYYLTKYVNRDTTVQMIDNVYRQKEFYASTAHLFRLAKGWDASVAYDLGWNTMDADMHGFVYPTRWSHLLSAATSLTVGPLSAQASVVYTHIDDKTRLAESPTDKNVWTPAVYLSWKPFSPLAAQGGIWSALSPLALRAYYKKSFRMPTFNDLYYADMGNSRLEPEHTQQWNVGLVYDSPQRHARQANFGFTADIYYNKVKDKIVAYPKGTQFRWTMLNLGRVEIRGLDATLHATLHPARRLTLTGKLQYTWQEAIDVTSPADTYYRHQIPYIPWHSGSAIAQVQWRQWGVNYSFIYTGERYNQQENIVYNHTQPWYTSDLSLLRDFLLWGYQMRAMLEVNNLFSQDYDVILNYPMPKRNYRLTLKVEI